MSFKATNAESGLMVFDQAYVNAYKPFYLFYTSSFVGRFTFSIVDLNANNRSHKPQDIES